MGSNLLLVERAGASERQSSDLVVSTVLQSRKEAKSMLLGEGCRRAGSGGESDATRGRWGRVSLLRCSTVSSLGARRTLN